MKDREVRLKSKIEVSEAKGKGQKAINGKQIQGIRCGVSATKEVARENENKTEKYNGTSHIDRSQFSKIPQSNGNVMPIE
ncbi:unnamed protein product [Dovyalis caffra]|uniref:Uncharacterized protein n=1 Tax=Dovyalis caffra TaxID=77055 RepID=A0AAV1S3L1_9ROSI|nr:unnamed protein product [Dovyalis caffra]